MQIQQLVQPSYASLTAKLAFKPSLKETDCTKHIIELAAILNKYESWDDLVSLQIKDWGERALTPLPADKEQFLLQKVENDVAELFYKVLYSQGLVPLKNPILDGKWTWEASELQEYCRRNKGLLLSPYGDCGPLNLEAMQPHSFAIDIIQWGTQLPIELMEEPRAAALRIHRPLAQSLSLPPPAQEEAEGQTAIVLKPEQEQQLAKELKKQRKEYVKLGHIANQQLCSQQFCQVIKQGTRELSLSREEVEEYVRHKKELFKLELAKKFEVLEEKIDHNDKIHAETTKIIEARVKQKDDEVRHGLAMLKASEQRLALAEARADVLGAQLSQAQKQLAQPSKGGRRGCTLF